MDAIRTEVVRLLEGKGAHADFDRAVQDFPESLRCVRPENSPHSAWELLEHLRIAQADMLHFSQDPDYTSPEWPKGYWPDSPVPPTASAWDESIQTFRTDLQAMKDLVSDPSADLTKPFDHGEGQSILREALQLADHNAYHIGELVFLRRLLKSW